MEEIIKIIQPLLLVAVCLWALYLNHSLNKHKELMSAFMGVLELLADKRAEVRRLDDKTVKVFPIHE
jgi:hypothetical protein